MTKTFAPRKFPIFYCSEGNLLYSRSQITLGMQRVSIVEHPTGKRLEDTSVTLTSPNALPMSGMTVARYDLTACTKLRSKGFQITMSQIAIAKELLHTMFTLRCYDDTKCPELTVGVTDPREGI